MAAPSTLTVDQLRRALANLPGDKLVAIWDCDGGEWYPAEAVEPDVAVLQYVGLGPKYDYVGGYVGIGPGPAVKKENGQ